MKVWLLTVGEPLPTPGDSSRLLRTGLLAQALTDRGHEVVWWTSTLDSFTRQQRYGRDTQVESTIGYEISLLRSVGYGRHASVRRIVEHEGVARKFRRLARRRSSPELIVASYPTLELCREAIKFGHERRIPVVLDVRDLWPHVILDRMPKILGHATRLPLGPMFRLASRLSAEATAVTAVSPEAMAWFLKLSGRSPTPLDSAFPPGYSACPPGPDALAGGAALWQSMGVHQDGQTLVVAFVGSFTRNFEFSTVIEAAQQLDRRAVPVRFVLCGTGPLIETCRDQARGLPNILFPGWVDAGQIWTLLRLSSVGLACYIDNRNFRHVLPNKPIEYLSAGLPVLSSAKGAIERVLKDYNCGVTYDGRSAADLCRALEFILAQPSARAQMSTNAANAFELHFSAERVYGDMVEHLSQVERAFHVIPARPTPLAPIIRAPSRLE